MNLSKSIIRRHTLLKNLTKLSVASLVAALTLSSTAMAFATPVPVPSSPVQVAVAETDSIYVVESVGDKIWAATITTRKVLKISKDTGLIENTYTLPAGSTGSIFKSSVDSNYIWLSHFNSVGITRVKLSDGSSQLFSAGLAANADLVSDGEFVWVAAPAANRVYKVDAATGSVISNTSLTNPMRVETNGTDVWVAHGPGGRTLAKLNRATGVVESGLGTVPTGISNAAHSVAAMAMSGTSLFVGSDAGGIYELSIADGTFISQLAQPGTNLGAIAIFQGTLIALSSGSTTSEQFNLVSRTGGVPTSEGTFVHPPSGIFSGVHDGTNLWVANVSTDLFKFTAACQALSGSVCPIPVEVTPPAPASTSPTATVPASTSPTATTPVLATTGTNSVATLSLAASLVATGSALILWRRRLKRSLPVTG